MLATSASDSPSATSPVSRSCPAISTSASRWRAFAVLRNASEPGTGESIGALLEQGPPSPALANLDADATGYAWLLEDDFVGHFAADVDPARARVMHAAQQPFALSTLGEVIGVPAWRSQPSWFLVAQNDEAIPADAERQFAARMGATTVEVPSSHVPMVSRPDDVTALIVRAAEAVRAPVTTG